LSKRYSTRDSARLYDVAAWGNGYFSINQQGHVAVHPGRDPEHSMDLRELVDEAVDRGISLPLLLRFSDILADRVSQIQGAFDVARRDHDYTGGYCTVYPIKVNQQRHVVEAIQQAGEPLGMGFGLEVGSKPELLAVLAIANNTTPIMCNGFKDAEYIETVILAQKVGRKITTIVEQEKELDLILASARDHGVRPSIGVRVKPAARGSGRWSDSGGYGSKFGLSVAQTLSALARLEAVGMADCFELLHYHMGSQITEIRHIKTAVTEVARIYVGLVAAGAGLTTLDVGGGLGVDYDGSQSNTDSSINYTLQEYANDVIAPVQAVCDEAGVAHPRIITECGRALTAHHSVLLFEVVGSSAHGDLAEGIQSIPEDLPAAPQPLRDLLDAYQSAPGGSLAESFHDAEIGLDRSIDLFSFGHMSLQDRALAEAIYWATCWRIYERIDRLDFVPEELRRLSRLVARQYFCNFSLFQSMPDSWAIDQLFPIMPIQRLDEEPTVPGVLADVSCDSDGKVDRFIGRQGTESTLMLHEVGDESYVLGVFLVGAYQEILGDLHNLFGDTNAIHVTYTPETGAVFEEVVDGDRVSEVLHYVQFNHDELRRRFRRDVETAVRDGKLTGTESGQLLRFYEAGLQGYTYLE
jgi:arginine decarboxylase